MLQFKNLHKNKINSSSWEVETLCLRSWINCYGIYAPQETSIVKVLVGREFTGGDDNDLSSLIVVPTNLNNSMFSNVCKVSLCLLLSVNTGRHWRSDLTSNLDLSGQLEGEILVYGPIRHGRVDTSTITNSWSNCCGRNLFVKVIFFFGFPLKKLSIIELQLRLIVMVSWQGWVGIFCIIDNSWNN